MKDFVNIITLLLVLPAVLAQICWTNVSVPYVKWSTKWVSRQSRCDFKCWGKWQSSWLDSSYNTNTCDLAFYTESVPTCCSGYEKDLQGECKPVCEDGCINGVCNEPNMCSCDEGFQLRGSHCVPVCESQCIHGECTSPGQCTCLPGYTNKSDSECVPVCDPPCENGKCITPNTCECNHGFVKSLKSINTCTPTCDPELADCGSGTCIEPNRCLCESGFVFRDRRCVPQCDSTCINGECTEPNTCTCVEGFAKSQQDANVCVPICNGGCQNGSCIAPNICECTLGYNRTLSDPNACEPTCDPTYMDISDGQCIAPNVLRCNEGFQLEHSSQSNLMKCKPLKLEPETVPDVLSLTDLLSSAFR